MSPKNALHEAHPVLIDALAADDDQGWAATGCAGWSVQDLVHHLLGDAQRGLVALHTPAHDSADTDEVTYWQDWQPGTDAAAADRRYALVGTGRAPLSTAEAATLRPLAARFPLFG